jgi:hypothetical protein
VFNSLAAVVGRRKSLVFLDDGGMDQGL